MKITYGITFTALMLALLSSCDPQTCGTVFIENNSSGTIYLHRDTLKSDTLQAGKTLSLDPVCGLGDGQTPYQTHNYSWVRNDSLFCKKNINMDSNWTTIHDKKYKWEHYFKVSDADF